MAISASQITTNNTLEQLRSEFNNLRDDVSGLESGTATFSAISATTLGSSNVTVQQSGTVIFEGESADAFETTLTVLDPNADRTVTLPNQTGLISLVAGLKTAADDDIVLDATDATGSDADGRLLLEDAMSGDTISVLSSHNVTFTDNTLNASAISSTSLSGTTLNVLEDGIIKFEGATDNAFETSLTVVDPTADRTISFPNQTGLVGLIGGVKTAADDDIVLDGTDSSSTDDGSRLLLEDVMDGDTGSFLAGHGITFANNDLSLSGGISGNLSLTSGSIVFEGASADAFETTLSVTDPTIDRTITLPNQTGTVGLLGGVKSNAEDDIVLDGTDSSSTDAGGRLLLEDVMDGDTGSFLSQHGMTFSNNDTSISGKLTVSGGIDGNLLATGNFIFEGSTVDAFETTLTAIDPTVDRTISLPNQTGLIGLIGGVRTADDDDIVLDGTDSSGTGAGNRLLLEDVMDGDTSGFLSGHGVTFSNNNLSLSGGIDGNLLLTSGSIIFEGATDDSSETTLAVTDPTEDRTITLPNQSGIVDLLDGIKTAAEDDIVLDGTDSSSTDAGSRLLLEDITDDTGSFLSQHGLTFSNNDASISGKLSVAGGIDGNLLSSGNFIFEGSTVDAFETTLTAVDPTEDRTITFPNQTGIVDLVDGLKSDADEDIVLDGTDSSSTDAGGRLLLQDAMQGDTGDFLAGHGITFADNVFQISAGIKLNGVEVIPSTTASALSTVDDATALAIALG